MHTYLVLDSKIWTEFIDACSIYMIKLCSFEHIIMLFHIMHPLYVHRDRHDYFHATSFSAEELKFREELLQLRATETWEEMKVVPG